MRRIRDTVLIPDPDFYPSRIPDLGSRMPDLGSRIPDPKTATKERGEKKFVAIPLYVATKLHKIENYFSFVVLKKKIWANFQRILELFTRKKLSLSSQKYGFGIWDPGSEIRAPGSGKTDPGSRGQKGTGSRIRIRNTDK